MHLDFHTMPRVYDVGAEFDAESWAQTLQEARVDYITVFGRCNLGFAYYPTSVGLPHPGLQIADMLGPMIEACHARAIRVAVYVNAGIDHEHALRHREWCKVNKDGQVYKLQQMGHFFRTLCLNTGYRPHILSMVEEILTDYPVDGLFLDCFDLSSCYGVECLDGMRDEGMGAADEAQAREYCFGLTLGAGGREGGPSAFRRIPKDIRRPPRTPAGPRCSVPPPRQNPNHRRACSGR